MAYTPAHKHRRSLVRTWTNHIPPQTNVELVKQTARARWKRLLPSIWFRQLFPCAARQNPQRLLPDEPPGSHRFMDPLSMNWCAGINYAAIQTTARHLNWHRSMIESRSAVAQPWRRFVPICWSNRARSLMDERRYADQEMRYSKIRTDYMKYVAHIWRRVL